MTQGKHMTAIGKAHGKALHVRIAGADEDGRAALDAFAGRWYAHAGAPGTRHPLASDGGGAVWTEYLSLAQTAGLLAVL